MGETMKRSISKQIADAKREYRYMLDHFLNEIVQVDEKTPNMEYKEDWWLDMMRINRLVLECKANLGVIE